MRNTVSNVLFFKHFSRGRADGDGDVRHAALEMDGFFSAPLPAFPVSAPLAEMFQSQTVISAHFQL